MDVSRSRQGVLEVELFTVSQQMRRACTCCSLHSIPMQWNVQFGFRFPVALTTSILLLLRMEIRQVEWTDLWEPRNNVPVCVEKLRSWRRCDEAFAVLTFEANWSFAVSDRLVTGEVIRDRADGLWPVCGTEADGCNCEELASCILRGCHFCVHYCPPEASIQQQPSLQPLVCWRSLQHPNVLGLKLSMSNDQLIRQRHPSDEITTLRITTRQDAFKWCSKVTDACSWLSPLCSWLIVWNLLQQANAWNIPLPEEFQLLCEVRHRILEKGSCQWRLESTSGWWLTTMVWCVGYCLWCVGRCRSLR